MHADAPPANGANEGTRLDRVSLDAALGALGVLVGAASLWFPFGRDQGRYAYVGREWLHGAMPYRDLFDDQWPGVYALHAVSVALFGETTWGIRALELAAVIGIGVMAAGVAEARGATPARGARGAGVLAASVLYYGFQSFWDSAQPDIWCSTFGLASVWAACRLARSSRGSIAAGAFAGLAILVKPAAACFGVVALALLWRRERTSRVLLLFFAGLFAPLVACFGHFAAHGASGSVRELLVDAGGYVARENADFGPRKILSKALFEYRYTAPLSAVMISAIVVALAIAHRHRDAERRERWSIGGALLAAGFAAVVVQRRFFGSDWAALVGPGAAILANLARDVRVWAAPRPRSMKLALAAAFALAWVTSDGCRNWAASTGAVALRIAGRTDAQDFDRFFSIADLHFDALAAHEVSDWLAAHSTSADLVCVRGFEPEIYVTSHTRCGDRFFWTTFLTSPTRMYHQGMFYDEDRGWLASHSPRYVVAVKAAKIGPDAPSTFEAQGYVVAATFGGLAILEHHP